jgi:hypothetical protein
MCPSNFSLCRLQVYPRDRVTLHNKDSKEITYRDAKAWIVKASLIMLNEADFLVAAELLSLYMTSPNCIMPSFHPPHTFLEHPSRLSQT